MYLKMISKSYLRFIDWHPVHWYSVPGQPGTRLWPHLDGSEHKQRPQLQRHARKPARITIRLCWSQCFCNTSTFWWKALVNSVARLLECKKCNLPAFSGPLFCHFMQPVGGLRYQKITLWNPFSNLYRASWARCVDGRGAILPSQWIVKMISVGKLRSVSLNNTRIKWCCLD